MVSQIFFGLAMGAVGIDEFILANVIAQTLEIGCVFSGLAILAIIMRIHEMQMEYAAVKGNIR